MTSKRKCVLTETSKYKVLKLHETYLSMKEEFPCIYRKFLLRQVRQNTFPRALRMWKARGAKDFVERIASHFWSVVAGNQSGTQPRSQGLRGETVTKTLVKFVLSFQNFGERIACAVRHNRIQLYCQPRSQGLRGETVTKTLVKFILSFQNFWKKIACAVRHNSDCNTVEYGFVALLMRFFSQNFGI